MIGIEMKKLDYDDHFYRFCELMFRYQYTKEKVQFDSSYATLFYKLTNGNTAMMKSLFIEAQKHSIITGIEKLSLDLIKDTTIITLEENSIVGGFGDGVRRYYAKNQRAVKLKCYGAEDKFINHGTIETQLKENGLTIERVLSDLNFQK
jgi:deoxyxylulose-5-phosphate synthase